MHPNVLIESGCTYAPVPGTLCTSHLGAPVIILDTSILRSINPESSSANLLHAISVAAHETVAMPWMVREELAAQQAIKYESVHAKAVAAVEALRQTAPWDFTAPIHAGNTERHRNYWRKRWTPPLNVIPTSEKALREGMYREANLLPPCRLVKDVKTGARDTAIWLSAVEYAREHPGEAVFFVSANTKDFGDGSAPLPSPMDRDVDGMEDRFRVLTSIEELAANFTEPVDISAQAAAAALDTSGVQQAILHESLRTPSLLATIPLDEDYSRVIVEVAEEWQALEANVGTVEDVQGYRIGQREWCTATVEWQIVGSMHSSFGYGFGAVSWPTTVLFNLSGDPNLTVVRDKMPQPATLEVVSELGVPAPDVTTVEAGLITLRREKAHAAYELIEDEHARNAVKSVGLHRPYTGALKRRVATRRIQEPTDD